MQNDLESVSYYDHTGYQTLEGEIEEHQRTREHFRQILLAGIRGHLREESRLRWWIVAILAVCGVTAWQFAAAIHSNGRFSWLWLPAWGVVAAWPVYILGLRWRAGREVHRFDLSGHWEYLHTRDELGELRDRKISAHINQGLSQAQNQHGNGFTGIIAIGVVTLGTWVIWDLLRTGPETTAEIMLDGIIAPAHPTIAVKIPTEVWYKNALGRTALHFFTLAIAATLVTLLVLYSPDLARQ